MLDTGRIYAQSRIDILRGQPGIRARLKNFFDAAKRSKRRKRSPSSSVLKATAVAFDLGTADSELSPESELECSNVMMRDEL
ncbi:hypothetical protein CSPX01_15424 [Colletotrichum filicis]|nr:hypothetical protein CSPX01_15424 [Colletotrichum filicis]